ncbi:MAG: hypothetical protein HY237_09350 [Acidobacteria bacterium]|nr:hypothetical protein [Acidobacteriota bacterium]
MLGNISAAAGKRQLQAAGIGLGALGLIWVLATWVVAGSSTQLILAGLVVIVVGIVVSILNDWRSGFYLFLIWLLFEDLARKYLGNNMAVYFGKDVLVGVTYLSFFLAHRRGRVDSFRPPFMVPLSLFFWLGVVQVFNPESPSLLYGLLGLKLYFYYIPLMFVSYALLRTGADLRKFLALNLALGGLIAVLGIVQAIVGLDFLNPQVLAPELQSLGRLTRQAPISGELVPVPTSVFVSGGRFSWYLILAWIMFMGTQGYLLLRGGRRVLFGFVGIGIVTVAAMVSGVRAAVVYIGASALVLSAAFLWGAPWRWGHGHRLVKSLRRSFVGAGLALLLMVQLFPKSIGANWSFYSETLAPSGPGSELVSRTWDYPIRNLVGAFENPRWPYGYGTGTSSLGVQYVSRLLGERTIDMTVESGYGTLVVELGILGLILWVMWTFALLRAGWKVVRQLKQTAMFPIGFSILWFAALLLIAFTYMGLAPYQNFVFNAYLWMLVGVVFRLPTLAAQAPEPAKAHVQAARMAQSTVSAGGR